MSSNFNTKWVKFEGELPTIGVQCPACEEGIIGDNSFVSKKGEPFKSVSCKTCRTDWVISHWKNDGTDFKTTPAMKKENEEFKVEDEGEKILAEIQRIHLRLDQLAIYLKEQFGEQV
jgi:hypothetical protein